MGLSQIKASNGNGEAVRASVTTLRTPGSMTLKLDAITNWPNEFVATSGVLSPDGTIDPNTVTVFAGHISGSDVIIDEFAPGYADEGNSVGDIVVIKPATLWADIIANFLAVSHKDDGTLAQIDSNEPGLRLAVQADQPAPDPDGNIILWFEPLE